MHVSRDKLLTLFFYNIAFVIQFIILDYRFDEMYMTCSK